MKLITLSFSKEQVNLFKGFAILFIVFHNFLHLLDPFIEENEFAFDINVINNFILFFQHGNWAERINLFFSIWGHYGVSLFVFLSGYGLFFSWKTLQDNNTKFLKTVTNYFTFLFQRIAKLYPTLLLTLSIYFLFFFFRTEELPVGKELTSYLVKLTFTSNLFPYELFSLNGPWWFYSLIVQLYIILPIIYFVSVKTKGYGVLVIAFVMILADYFIAPIFNKNFPINYYALPFHYIPLFSIGLLFAQYAHKQINRIFILIISLTIFCLGNYFFSFWIISGIAFSLLTISLLSLLKEKTVFAQIILFFGNISMYLFAIHGFLRLPFLAYVRQYASSHEQFFVAILFVGISTFSAWCMSLIEPKIRPIFTQLLPTLKKQFKENEDLIHQFTKQSFLFLILFLLIRLVESFLIYSQGIHHPFLVTGLIQDLIMFGKLNSISFLLFCLCLTYLQKKNVFILNSLFWSAITSFAFILSLSFVQYSSFQTSSLFSYQYLIAFGIYCMISLWINKKGVFFLQHHWIQKGLLYCSFFCLIISHQFIIKEGPNLTSFIVQNNKINYLLHYGFNVQNTSEYELRKRHQYHDSWFLYTSDFESPKELSELEKVVSSEYSYSGKNALKTSVYNQTSPLLSSFPLKDSLQSFNVIIEGKVLIQKGVKNISDIILEVKDRNDQSIQYHKIPLKKCTYQNVLVHNQWLPFRIEQKIKAKKNQLFTQSKINLFFKNETHSLFYYDDLTIAINDVKTFQDLTAKTIYTHQSSFEDNTPSSSTLLSYLGSKSFHISKNTDFASLYEGYTITKQDAQSNQLLWQSDFRLLVTKEENELGEIVIQITRKNAKNHLYWYNENLLHKTISKKVLTKNIWHHIHFTHKINPQKLALQEGDCIKFFLWTHKTKNFYCDDLKVKIKRDIK